MGPIAALRPVSSVSLCDSRSCQSLFTPSIYLQRNSAFHSLQTRFNSCQVSFRLDRRQVCKGETWKERASVSCHAAKSDGNDANQRSAERISADAKIRSEVTAPFRSLRMVLFPFFIASAGIGGLIALTRVIAGLGGAPNADPLSDTLTDLAVDLGAVALFAFLFSRDKTSEKKALARITREETLSRLRIELSTNRIVTVGQMRGACRLIILAGPRSHIEEAFRQAEEVKEALVERGVLLVPFCTDGSLRLDDLFKEAELPGVAKTAEGGAKADGGNGAMAQVNRRFVALPIYANEWERWLAEQMELANVATGKPVYISLRIDGRVRGSGVGFPPFRAISMQLPPLKGMWGGALDGMDGRVN
eukprot:TRINITY_DN689_c1_g2_i1.p1 TRINITY_DN689_c1_g2~~TRINITY_DN689_c1_g2_i1.p1  ORF type:complete len:362 (+),score=44.12 TRINITY_DN689_c1_g2_i1:140-1225(+)